MALPNIRLSPLYHSRLQRLAKIYGSRRTALEAGIEALEQLEKERWRRVRPFHVADDSDGEYTPTPDILDAGQQQPEPVVKIQEFSKVLPIYHGKVRVREGAVVVGQRIPWYANAYDFVQNYASEITIVSLGQRFDHPPRQYAYYQITQIDTAPNHLKVGDVIQLQSKHFVRVIRLNAVVIHYGRPVMPVSVEVTAECETYVSEYQIMREKDKLPVRHQAPPVPYQRSFKEEVALPDLLDDLTVAQEPVRQDVLTIFSLVDRTPDAAASKDFMKNAKALWTDEERAAYQRLNVYRKRRRYGWEP